MPDLSKTKLLAFRQCPRRLWLDTHRRDLLIEDAGTKARFAAGNRLGELARNLYDPQGTGTLLNPFAEGFATAIKRTSALLCAARPIFEAGFRAAGGLAFADVMLPVARKGTASWRMVEVKSSASVKDHHLDDAAVQACVARASGVKLTSVSIAHIDSSWVYPGAGNYAGLLVERDVTEQAFGRDAEVRRWIAGASDVVSKKSEPVGPTGKHCNEPQACGYIAYCRGSEPVAQFPITWLPRITSKALKQFIIDAETTDLREIPDELLNESQLRVKEVTLSNRTFFDAEGADIALGPQSWPAYFIDFETARFTIPIWPGTRPFQQVPYQFSLHRLSSVGKLDHVEYLELSGADPLRPFAEALVVQCGTQGPVYVYNAGFEAARINELAAQFVDLEPALLAIGKRIVDLLPVARSHYYHPSQAGSWSIKKVLPAVAPDLSYNALEGIADGGQAMAAFEEAIAPDSTAERREEIGRQLHAYCYLDTYAMVRLWLFFTGREPAFVEPPAAQLH